MTSASKSRIQRRAGAKALAEKTAYKPGDAPKAILTLTEIPNTGGGFSVGLGLHGARMEELFPGKPQTVSVVDILALALSDLVRSQPQAFQDAFNKAKATIFGINTALEAGVDVNEAVAAATLALTTPAAGTGTEEAAEADDAEVAVANVA